jgi:hypothetical protein
VLHHIVLFTLKDEIKPEDRDYILGQARKLDSIDSVRRLSVTSLLDPSDAAYRNHIWDEFQHALLIEFDDEEGLQAYQKDAFHAQFAREIRERADRIRVIDFV